MSTFSPADWLDKSLERFISHVPSCQGGVKGRSMYELFNKKFLKQHRRNLRNDMPDAEKKVWRLLQGKSLDGYKFRRQHGIGPYIVDFYCPKLQLAIEIDGDSHFEGDAPKKDKLRETLIPSKGIEIIRFTNIDVLQNIDAVAEEIFSIARRLTSPTPSLAGGETQINVEMR